MQKIQIALIFRKSYRGTTNISQFYPNFAEEERRKFFSLTKKKILLPNKLFGSFQDLPIFAS